MLGFWFLKVFWWFCKGFSNLSVAHGVYCSAFRDMFRGSGFNPKGPSTYTLLTTELQNYYP